MRVINLFGVGATFKFVNFYEFNYELEEWFLKSHIEMKLPTDFCNLMQSQISLASHRVDHIEFEQDIINIYLD